ncbi:Hypothetical protein ADU72_1102 [Pediococcus damnosus]|uniref:Uncharacterized protein n=1 Tax=Pediococcus damnosus TaxID=51663 RepID=A0ABM6A3T2_9LACO|nr:hypothetical protein [Pediococcus damnosus]AMV64772.1 Hypothetical protein ADU71_0866 [Pediococcus damnosus]AMV67035.1 Hypothetical protein ADU72_1102 [Pediococcus damnosus]AMV69362.1 Hypothetical protein ADU73_0956 [Pediococcus damnosus]KRN53680.1 hypothetical protein IV84_GL001893 [Pediococcus damnosus]GEA92616.1 hypothetical protein PDA01_05090 [Pediococcus damnosus]
MIIIKIIGIILLLALGAYFVNGGWADNLGALYRNYKQSKLSLRAFIKTIIKKG